MSDQFRQWLTSEMEKRRYSQGALARAIGMSRPFVSRVLSGEKAPSLDFLIKVAQAFGESPEKVLRLAGILPASPASEGDTLQELMELARSLPPEDQQELLKYARFRYQQRND
jgi:transcriptional regulator with XRE-family HTH domain